MRSAPNGRISLPIFTYSRFLRCVLARSRSLALWLALIHSFFHSFSPHSFSVHFTLACLFVYSPVLQVRWMFHAISRSLSLNASIVVYSFAFFLHCTGLLFSHCVAVVLSYNHNLNAGKVFCLFSFILPRFRLLCLRICV